jgi:hypothetical protein
LALEPANQEGVGKVEVRRSVVGVAARMIDQMTESEGRRRIWFKKYLTRMMK